MDDRQTTVGELRAMVASFVEERDWRQFHSAKNLSMSIAIEAAELMELFQWTDGEAADDRQLARVGEELADVVIYCLSLANALELDLARAVRDKVEANGRKYPAARFRGGFR
ncbi:MAG: nucleotide pyrophosphohydrolase [Peptococcaceae bacterium]|jgi:NTP pyrophosphatase (non-canonical NTP hydrolase)|nr:nucleotide pyrophosphohydrolase [Peptococcaceae bacterium]